MYIKKFLILNLFLFSGLTPFANSDLEERLEHTIDSAFVENDIKWNEAYNEFMTFAKSVYKKTDDPISFLEYVIEKPKKAENNIIRSSFQFLHFNAINKNTVVLLKTIKNTLFQFALNDDDKSTYCKANLITGLYWLSYEYSLFYTYRYIQNVATNVSKLALKINSTDLQNKIILILCAQYFFEGKPQGLYSNSVEIDLNKIELEHCDYDTTKINLDEKIEGNGTENETDPCFFGGEKYLAMYLASTIVYPKEARENGIQGTVYTSFVVHTDGSIQEVCVLKSPHESLSKESARVIQNIPRWMPGTQNGKPIRVRYRIPIKFTIA